MPFSVGDIYSVQKSLEARAVDTYSSSNEKYRNIKLKKYQGNKNKENEDNEGDYITISVKALILFLENIIETRLNTNLYFDNEGNNIKKDDNVNISPWIKNKPSNDIKIRNAVNAYKHVANSVCRSDGINSNNISHNLTHINNIDTKEIYSIVNDLRYLQDNGIQYLNINNKISLVEGVIDAINIRKPSINK